MLQKITELAEQGELQLYRFPNRPSFVPLDNSDLIPKVIKWYNNGFTGVLDSFLTVYPELTDKLNEQLEQAEKSS